MKRRADPLNKKSLTSAASPAASVEYGRITSVESECGAYAVCSTVVLQ